LRGAWGGSTWCQNGGLSNGHFLVDSIKGTALEAEKQPLQFRLIPEDVLGMISIYYWTGGYSMPVCGSN
jgi:hypothetical protein